MKKLKCASFFAGVGGIDLGFERTGLFETIYANEFDEYPARTYEENFKIKVDLRDINLVQAHEIPNFDVMLAGFPCQAFSVAGNRKGFDDEKGRGALFFQLVRILKDKKPPLVFLENVKNLVGHDNGNTFSVILDELKQLGYFVKYAVLNLGRICCPGCLSPGGFYIPLGLCVPYNRIVPLYLILPRISGILYNHFS